MHSRKAGAATCLLVEIPLETANTVLRGVVALVARRCGPIVSIGWPRTTRWTVCPEGTTIEVLVMVYLYRFGQLARL